MTVFTDVFDDGFHRLCGVAQAVECTRDRLVDDLHRAATHELFELDQREVRLNAGGVAVHHEADGSGRGQHRSLGVTPAVLCTDLVTQGPVLGSQLQNVGVQS